MTRDDIKCDGCGHPWNDHSKRGRSIEEQQQRCHGDEGTCRCLTWICVTGIELDRTYDPQVAEIAEDEYATRYALLATLNSMAREQRGVRRAVDAFGCAFVFLLAFIWMGIAVLCRRLP